MYLSKSQIMPLPLLIDAAPLRGAPVRLPMEVIHKLCLIHLYLLSKEQNVFVKYAKCICLNCKMWRSIVEVI